MRRKIATVRHGERVDFTFSDDWVQKCFDQEGIYSRQNLNQPEAVPKRKGSPQTFIGDTPLTQIGCLQGRLVGTGLAEQKILNEGFEVIVSPSLRCIETATEILKGMGLNLKLKIEPCLFEWTNWYIARMPHFMTAEEFKAAGFNIDESYKPMMTLEELKDGETIENYYNRSYKLMQHLLQTTDRKDLLLVAHGSSLDTNSRQLLGHPSRSARDMMGVLRAIPYCGVAVMEEDEKSGAWSLADAPRLHLCHGEVRDFDAKPLFYGSGTTLANPASQFSHN